MKEQWQQLEKQCRNQTISSSFYNVYSWWKHFGNIHNAQYGFYKRLAVLCLYNNDKLTAIAPFCLVKRRLKKYFFYTSLEFIGQQWFGTFCDILGKPLDEEGKNFLWEWIYRHLKFDVFQLKYIPEFTGNFDLNSREATLFAACPVIDELDYEKIAANYSKNLKQNMRTALNRMKKNSVSFETKVFSQFNDDLARQVKHVSASKLKDNKHSHYENETKESFLWDYFSSSNLNIVGLFLNNHLAAYRVNVIYNENKFCIDASYDREFKRFELGALSVDENIKDSCKRGLKAHYMGMGMDDYKLKFTKKAVKVYSYIDKGNTILGRFLYRRRQMAHKRDEGTFYIELGRKIPGYNE